MLGEMGAKEAVPHLLGLLKSHKAPERSKVIQALGKIGSIDALFPVMEHLKEKEPYLRAHAVGALRRIRAKLLESGQNFTPKQPLHFSLLFIHPADHPKAFKEFYGQVKRKPNKSPNFWKLLAKQLTAIERKLK